MRITDVVPLAAAVAVVNAYRPSAGFPGGYGVATPPSSSTEAYHGVVGSASSSINTRGSSGAWAAGVRSSAAGPLPSLYARNYAPRPSPNSDPVIESSSSAAYQWYAASVDPTPSSWATATRYVSDTSGPSYAAPSSSKASYVVVSSVAYGDHAPVIPSASSSAYAAPSNQSSSAAGYAFPSSSVAAYSKPAPSSTWAAYAPSSPVAEGTYSIADPGFGGWSSTTADYVTSSSTPVAANPYSRRSTGGYGSSNSTSAPAYSTADPVVPSSSSGAYASPSSSVAHSSQSWSSVAYVAPPSSSATYAAPPSLAAYAAPSSVDHTQIAPTSSAAYNRTAPEPSSSSVVSSYASPPSADPVSAETASVVASSSAPAYVAPVPTSSANAAHHGGYSRGNKKRTDALFSDALLSDETSSKPHHYGYFVPTGGLDGPLGGRPGNAFPTGSVGGDFEEGDTEADASLRKFRRRSTQNNSPFGRMFNAW